MKRRITVVLAIFFIGGLGGVVLNNLVLPALVEADFLSSGNILNALVKPQIQTVIQTNETTTVVKPDIWQDVAAQADDSIVFIQAFNRGSLIAQGSGAILTTDGIIATSLNNVPYSASVFQLFIRDTIVTGEVVFRNTENNIAFIEVSENGLPVLDTAASDELAPGQTNAIVGKVVRTGGLSTFAQQAFVKEVLPNVYFIDTESSPELIGTALLNSSGRLIGLVQVNRQNEIFVSPSEVLLSLLNEI